MLDRFCSFIYFTLALCAYDACFEEQHDVVNLLQAAVQVQRPPKREYQVSPQHRTVIPPLHMQTHRQLKVLMDNRTCIVGAGPAGLSLSLWLTQRGQKVTLFEKEGRVGGKVHSWIDRSTGNVHDVGANGVYSGYSITKGLMKRFDVREDDEPCCVKYGMVSKHGLDRLSKHRLHHISHELDMLASEAPLWKSCYEYGFGYQSRNGTRQFNTNALQSMNKRYFEGDGATFPLLARQLKGGFQSLFDAMASALPEGTLRLNSSVLSLRRTNTSVWVNDEECSRVVITAVPTTLNTSWFTDEERQIFAELQTTAYFTSIVDCEHSSLDPSHELGLCDPSEPYAALLQRQHSDRYWTVFGYHNRQDTEATTKASMRTAMRNHGCKPADVEFFKVWYDYFPRFDQQNVDSGILKSIEAMQGSRLTYWTGTYMNVDVVEGALEYAKHIFDAYL